MYVLGIHLGHDSSVALVKDGEVVAACAEERLVGLKHYSLTPIRSLQFCLEKAGISIKDIDLVVIPAITTSPEIKVLLNLEDRVVLFPQGENIKKDLFYFVKFFLIKLIQLLRQTTEIELPAYINNFDFSKKEVINIEHHKAHAASAYYSAGFKEKTLVFTSDGAGDGLSLTLWLGENNQLVPLQKVSRNGSLGAFYSTVTEALGWMVGDGEGKTMGLAPYGNTKKTKDKLEFIRPRYQNGKLIKKYNWGWPGIFFDSGTEHWHFKQSEQVKKLIQKYGSENIAAECQRVLEDEIVSLLKVWLQKTEAKYLVAAGGVLLNVKVNQKILEECELENFYVFPDSGDSGIAVGAALYGYFLKNPNSQIKKINSVSWGPIYSDMQIKKVLDTRRIKYKKLDKESIPYEVAKLLSKGKIIGWFQGSMEMGPRALGNRSILMDPRYAENKDIINKTVKYRESFRPFCPSILDKAAEDYLEKLRDAPFMIISDNVKKGKEKEIPAVVHVDGTVRPQIVTKDINLLFYQLLERFGSLTGVPVLLNTSFNIKGEPIVATPEDAIKCFFDTGLDCLSIGSFLVSKE